MVDAVAALGAGFVRADLAHPLQHRDLEVALLEGNNEANIASGVSTSLYEKMIRKRKEREGAAFYAGPVWF